MADGGIASNGQMGVYGECAVGQRLVISMGAAIAKARAAMSHDLGLGQNEAATGHVVTLFLVAMQTSRAKSG